MAIEDTIETILKKNNGWLNSKDFEYDPRYYSYIKKLLNAGEIEKIKPGLFYSRAHANEDEWSTVAHIYPKAVFCLISALFYHELTTTIPAKHYIAFPHKSKISKVSYPPIKEHYWSNQNYELGILQTQNFKVYNLEKSVCDSVKFRNKIGEDIMLEALGNFMKRKDKNLNLLYSYAKQLRVDKIIKPYIQSLL